MTAKTNKKKYDCFATAITVNISDLLNVGGGMDKLRAAYRIAVIIGLAFMAGVLIYAVIVGLFENGTITLAGEAGLTGTTLEVVKFAMIGIAGILFPLMRFLSSKIMNAGADQMRQGSDPSSHEAGAPTEFGPLTTSTIITYALCEVPAIFGLVLYFIGRNSTDFYLFFLISMFFFATNFPKFSQWEEWYRLRQGGTGRRS